jgi:hypothetical protein
MAEWVLRAATRSRGLPVSGLLASHGPCMGPVLRFGRPVRTRGILSGLKQADQDLDR